jgi:hypothetical protein
MTTKERTCVCELKKITCSLVSMMWPVCDQEFEACSAELNWCRNIAADGNECAHDEACHQPTQLPEETK